MNALEKIKNTRGYTVEDISRLSGVPLPTVYAHLNGNRKIGHRSALRYTRLGVSLDELLTTQKEIEGV